MIKFTMGSSSDAKKTPRRKPKKAVATAVGKSGYSPASNPGVTTASLQTNGSFQTTRMPPTDSPSLPSYPQQGVQSMQTSTSGLEKEGESSSPMPLAKFYLDGDSCSFCRRSKVRTAEVNLHHFIESESGADLSTLPQLWMCLECQQSFDQRAINSVASDLNEEIVLDSPLSPTDEVSNLSPLDSNPCDCSSCAETRQIKEQNETFEQELQQYLYEDLHRLVAYVYQTSLTTLTSDVYDDYQLPFNNTKKLHNMMQNIYCRNPQRLFHCLESWAAALIMERHSAVCEQLPASFQQLTVSVASQFVMTLLHEYHCFCIISQNLMSFFDSQENTMLKEFRLMLELHQKYLFHQLIFAQLQKYLASAVTLISMQMTKLRKENAATANPHSQLLQKYAKFQDEMNRVLIHWTEYCQPTETSKDGKRQWQESQMHTHAKISETKTVSNVQTDGTDRYLMDRIWHLQEPNEPDVSAHYPDYSEFRMCKCDAESVLVCTGVDSTRASKLVAFPGHLLHSSGLQAVSFKNSSPSSSKRSGSSSSECSSQDDNCDNYQLLESFVSKSRSKLVNGDAESSSKNEMNKEDEEGEVDEHQAIGASGRFIVNLCDHCNENHLDTDEDSSNSDEDADDDGSNRRNDDAVERHETKDFKDAANVSNSFLRPAVDSSVPAVANLMTLNTTVSEAMASAVTSISGGAVAGASIANGNLFVFGEHSDAQVTIIQPTLQQQCQCSSCISSSIAADLPCQSLMPPLSSLCIYPHIHGSTMSSIQQGHIVNHDVSIPQPRQQHAFQLQGQRGCGVEQLNPKTLNAKSNADVYRNTLPDWDLRNSLFFKQDNSYGKLVLATNGGPSLTTLSLVPGASEAQTVGNDGNVWLKVDQPSMVTHSTILPHNGVAALSPGLFKISTNDLHLSQSLSNGPSIFPLGVPDTFTGIKGRIDHQPQYNFHQQPVAVTTSASDVFHMSSSFYQNTSSTTMFVQSPTFGRACGVSGTGTSVLCDLSCVKLPGELMANICVNDSQLRGTDTDSAVVNGTSTSVSMADFGTCTVDANSSNSMAAVNSRMPHCTSSGFSDVSGMYSVLPETMEQLNIGQGAVRTVCSSDHVNCTAARSNHIPLNCLHSLPQSGPGSQPLGCSDDQQSLTSCKTDSQQDEDDFNSQDESGSSSSNLKDGKFCDCWHCEVFGRSTPATLPTSKNYPEMRDRLRLRLKKKQNELKAVELDKTEETAEVIPVPQKSFEQNSSDLKDIEEVMKFINGEVDGDERPLNDELIKSKKKAAKRLRQKLRKQQQKVKEPSKPEMLSQEHQNRHCDKNQQNTVLSSHHLSSSRPTGCCKSAVTSSNPSLHDRSESSSSKKTNSEVENTMLLNMLNAMKLSGKCVGDMEKSAIGVSGMQNHCEAGKNGRFKMLGKNESSHSSFMNKFQENHTLAADMVKNGVLRQSTSRSCCLGEEESPRTSKARPRGSTGVSSQSAESEPRDDFCIEGEMKPVTISSEDGVRTILASPLLQAELAKNKPLQKLFMQAVQQQQLSREKQEANAAAEAKSCKQPMNQHASPMASQQLRTTKTSRKPDIVTSNSTCRTKSPVAGAATAESVGTMLDQRDIQSNEAKVMHQSPKNGSVPSQIGAAKIQPNGCQSIRTAAHQQSRTQSSCAPREKTQPSRTQPYAIPDEKFQENPTQYSAAAALRKTSQHVSKTCKVLNVASSASGIATQGISGATQREQRKKDCLPSSGSLLTNRLHPQICNGFGASVDTSLSTGAMSSVKSEAMMAEQKVLSKQINKKPVNGKKNKKSVVPELGLENNREMARKVICTTTNENCLQNLKVPVNGSPNKQIFPMTSPFFSDATELCANDCAEPCLSAKTKKNKKKSKSRGSLASVDEIFLPKNVPDDSHLDEHEREIEEFKRFCSNSAPSGNRQKVNLNNVKDMFNKKKAISAGYQ